ncbi:hypothetical protein GWI33_011692 [Rhynchophorus ferrugineus]|uniref:Uncharacterized protein n=1 Tax=Rhynchophorus ferrugineus TaxID=354439 RepID=A0A834I9C4_RHYFE|nr:hypothetical protein GWI33_011692 [Rhynchophorus ferrugineus]
MAVALTVTPRHPITAVPPPLSIMSPARFPRLYHPGSPLKIIVANVQVEKKSSPRWHNKLRVVAPSVETRRLVWSRPRWRRLRRRPNTLASYWQWKVSVGDSKLRIFLFNGLDLFSSTIEEVDYVFLSSLGAYT